MKLNFLLANRSMVRWFVTTLLLALFIASALIDNGNQPILLGLDPSILVLPQAAQAAALEYSVVATLPVGSNPAGVGVNHTTGRVYVANWGSSSVSVIDGANNTVIATVAVGIHPWGAAVNPVTNRIYVANNSSNTVSVIDGANNTVIATVPVDLYPTIVAVNPTTNRVYVVHKTYPGVVTVIDGASNTVVATITDEPDLTISIGVGVNPVTNLIYVANQDFSVKVIDGTSNTIIATIPTIDQPFGIDVNPTTNRIYVVICCDRIKVIDGESSVIVATIMVEDYPEFVGVNSTTNTIFVSNKNGDYIAAIDGASNTVIDTVAVGTQPWGVGVNPVTNQVYVANFSSNTVSVIEEGMPTAPGYASAPVTGSTIDVGQVKIGLPVTTVLTISETGDATLNVTSHSLSGPDAADFNVSPATLSILDGGAAQLLSIRCVPTALGLRTATLVVNHNATGSPATYTLNCTGQMAIYLPFVLRTMP